MKTSKKSDVGSVKVSTQLNGGTNRVSKDLSVKIAEYYLHLRINL
jgi:hypothetical protein